MIYHIHLEDELIASLKSQIIKLQKENIEVDGIRDLYDSLYINSYCNTYNKTRAYYVGYTLARANIDFKMTYIDK